MKEIANIIAGLSQDEISEIESKGQYTLKLSDGEALIESTDVEIATEDMPGWLVANEGSLTIALDIEVTEELRLEGIARELVNRIQNIRKSKNFEITDKISITFENNSNIADAVKQYNDYICTQVLAKSITFNEKVENATSLDFESFVVNVDITKI